MQWPLGFVRSGVVCWMCIVGVTTLGIFRNDPMIFYQLSIPWMHCFLCTVDWPSFLIVSSYSLVKSPISMAPHFWWTWSNRNHHDFFVAKNPAFFRFFFQQKLWLSRWSWRTWLHSSWLTSFRWSWWRRSWGDLSGFDPQKNHCLVVTWTWMDYDYPLTLGFFNRPNWLTHS